MPQLVIKPIRIPGKKGHEAVKNGLTSQVIHASQGKSCYRYKGCILINILDVSATPLSHVPTEPNELLGHTISSSSTTVSLASSQEKSSSHSEVITVDSDDDTPAMSESPTSQPDASSQCQSRKRPAPEEDPETELCRCVCHLRILCICKYLEFFRTSIQEMESTYLWILSSCKTRATQLPASCHV